MHVIAAKAVCFKEALQPEYKEYQKNIVKNAKALCNGLLKRGIQIVSGTTENHLMLVDLRGTGITGKDVYKRQVLEEAGDKEKTIIVDCPPGSACSVMESITDVDYCLLVAEPTAFGFHNFTMVHELAVLLGKPCGVVINKYEEPYQALEKYCEDKGLPILLRLPYDERIASCVSDGEILVEKLPEYRIAVSYTHLSRS